MMISFGSRIELLVDRYLIDQSDNLTFRTQPPKDCGCVIAFSQPWECPGSLSMTVLDDGKQIKQYYRGFPSVQNDASDRQTSCLSVSDDGLNFTPYPVNEISYDGITENNIIRMDTFCHNFAPFYDTNPACKPDERYKAIGGIIDQGGIHVFASPDGIHWHLLVDGPVITKGAFDSMNMAFWSPADGLYHCYSRFCYIPGEENGNKFAYNVVGNLRAIQSCTSEDFIHWTDPVPNEYAEGCPIDELYTNAARPVPGAEHIMISIPMRFHAYRKKLQEFNGNTWGSDGVSDAVLMTSRDGVHWDRSVKDAWLSGDVEEDREWTQRNFITAGGIIERDDKFYFYVEKHYMWDDGGIWAYSMPKYRLMSLYADGDGGSFVTKPLHFESDTISLNYRTSAYGYIRVTVRDMDGTTLYTSDEIYGNELSHTLIFEGLTGKEGTLLVEMKEANLYAIGAKMK